MTTTRAVAAALAACAVLGLRGSSRAAEPTVRTGSKAFTESVVLGEIVTQRLRAAGVPALHRREMGGTQILWQALRAGDVDAYPEYTGTISEEILAREGGAGGIHGEAALREALARHGVRMTRPLGFNDTYALGMREDRAARLGIRTISDLRHHPDLAFGLSNEFMDRKDGWPSLRARYGLPQRSVRGLHHDLAYRALASGAVQVTDLYSTDAEIRYYHLRVLEDDLRHFPEYQAVVLYRADLTARAPAAEAALKSLEGRIPAATMIDMNARVKLERVPEAVVAAQFLERLLGRATRAHVPGLAERFLARTREHLALVGVSLAAAIVFAVPLGVLAARRRTLGQVVLGAAGVLQTIPSLALLVFMIPVLGIGSAPAVVALFLYSLLPIVRNTYTGLRTIPPELIESADALGLPPDRRLLLVELPLASRSILAGIKTAAVINVGTATLGALIGAGGYGEPILTGIRLDDARLILEGAVPAAALALLAQGVFELAERRVVPRGLRLRRAD